jgi:hypothetical protein
MSDVVEEAYKEIIKCQQDVIESLQAVIVAQNATIMKINGIQS